MIHTSMAGDVESVLHAYQERLEKAWAVVSEGHTFPFLPSLWQEWQSEICLSNADRRELLLRLVGIDLYHRWNKAGPPGNGVEEGPRCEVRRNGRWWLEHYTSHLPELVSFGELPIDLIVTEYESLRLADYPIKLEEYRSRFSLQWEKLESKLVAIEKELQQASGAPSGDHSRQDAPAESGPCIPGYDKLEEIGKGGMGVVYKAQDVALNRTVALKMILTGRHAGAEASTRFRTEAKAMAQLEHPNIVKLYSFGEYDGCPYFTMEYVEGGTLEERLKSKSLPPKIAASLVATIALAIHHAHTKGIVHRDLKPCNVLFKFDSLSNDSGAISTSILKSTPKVADFGLAKLVGDDARLTRPDVRVGTLAYMAPEQALCLNESVREATDVYALGAILYECLTGQSPFKSYNSVALIYQICHKEPVRVRELQAEVSRDLEAVCLKCLEKESTKRYATAKALADDLDRFLAGLPTIARPLGLLQRLARVVRRNPWPSISVAVGTASALVILCITVWFISQQDRDAAAIAQARRDESTQRFYATLNAIRQRRVTHSPGWTAENLSDLGKLLEVSENAAATSLPELRSEAAAALVATDPRFVRNLAEGLLSYAVAFSPDGKWLAAAAWRGGEVRLVALKPGVEDFKLTFFTDPEWKRIDDEQEDGCRSVAFSPDGRWLVVGTRSGHLVSWNLALSPPVATRWAAHVADGDRLADGMSHKRRWVSAIQFSSDSKVLLSSTIDALRGWEVGGEWNQLWGQKPATLPRGSFPFGESAVVALTHDGKPYEAADLDLRTGAITGRQVDLQSPFCVTSAGDLFATAPLGKDGTALVPRDPKGHRQVLIAPLPDHAALPSIQSMVFDQSGALLVTGEEQERRIKIWDTASGLLLSELTARGGKGNVSGRVAFSPDGRLLAIVEEDRIALFELHKAVHQTVALCPERSILTGAVTDKGRTLFTISSNPLCALQVRRWTSDNLSVQLRGEWLSDKHGLSATPAADISPDGDSFVFTARYTLDKKPRERVLVAGSKELDALDANDVRFDPFGRLWVADSDLVSVFEFPRAMKAVQHKIAPEVPLPKSPVLTVAPGRRHTIAGRRDGHVIRIDPDGPAKAALLTKIGSGVVGLALSPDDNNDRVLIGGERGEVGLFRFSTGEMRLIPDAHRDTVRAVGFGPGYLVTGSTDRSVKFWTPAGDPLFSIRMMGMVRKLIVSRGGDRLFVFVEGERAVRTVNLIALHHELENLGIPPGIPLLQ